MGQSVTIDDDAWEDHAQWWDAEADQARQRLAVDDATLAQARSAFGKIGSSTVGAALAETLLARHEAGQRLGDYAQGVAGHIRGNLNDYCDTEQGNARRLRYAQGVGGGASGPDDTIVGPTPGKRTIQFVDSHTPMPQEPSPPAPEPPYLPPKPGAEPQIGPFPMPPEVAEAIPTLVGPMDPTHGMLTPQLVPSEQPGVPKVGGMPIPGITQAPPQVTPPPAPDPFSHPGCTDQQWRDAWLQYLGVGAGMGASIPFGPEAAIPSWVAGVPLTAANLDALLACTKPPVKP
jgi:hypothetical protein